MSSLPITRENTQSLNRSGVYALYCVNGSAYIGQALSLQKRLRGHVALLKRQKHRNPPLQAAWNKYGEDSFEFAVLQEAEREQLTELENAWFENFREQGIKLFNICPAGESRRGAKMSAESRRKVSIAQRGRKCSDETRRLMSLSRMGNQVMKGRRLSEEWKRNIGLGSHFRKLTPEEQARKGMARRKRYAFNSPDGRRVVIFGLNDWCLRYGLHLGAMIHVSAGKLNQHKGWRKAA